MISLNPNVSLASRDGDVITFGLRVYLALSDSAERRWEIRRS